MKQVLKLVAILTLIVGHCLASSRPAAAIVITIDPGPVGTIYGGPESGISYSTGIYDPPGSAIDTLSVFFDSKHLEINPLNGNDRLELRIDRFGGAPSGGNIFATFTFGLLDENGVPIPGNQRTCVNCAVATLEEAIDFGVLNPVDAYGFFLTFGSTIQTNSSAAFTFAFAQMDGPRTGDVVVAAGGPLVSIPPTIELPPRVSQVPVPAALPLYLSALGWLGLFVWRRRPKTD